ncbi:hypothetical protein [Clostridium sp.]|uniref:hypothetical protein n=1 Tax=Clostridium sp. TaxID=1506 RepID=UPI002931393D|nr:hypothetical protein [Clostridium sp.]
MNVIREHLVLDTEINSLVGENIFLFEKPPKSKAETYIIYNFKELNGGSSIRDYQLDIRIVSKDKLKLFPIKDRLIEILDNFNKPTKIKDSETIIRHTHLVNGGGIIKNEESGEYHLLVYFLVKI